MKKIISAINYFFFGTSRSMLLEERMLIIANLVGFFGSITGGIINFYLGDSLLSLLIPLFLAIILAVLFYFIRFKKKYTELVFPILIFSFFGIGLIWIFNGGYNGSNNFVFVTIFVLALTISPVKRFRFLYFFFSALIVFLNLFNYYFPERIVQFPNEETRFIDLIITIFYTTGFIYLMLTFLIRNYRAERQVSNERAKKLEEVNRELKLSNASKDRLFSIIAHDLKSPFNTIIGFSELSLLELQNGKIEKSREDILHSIASAKRTLVLLENLLSWAKTQSGLIEFEPEKLNLQIIMNEVMEDLDHSAKIKNISIIYFESDKVEIFADKNMVQTILRNLVSNAIKFTYSGGKVRIFAKTLADFAEITVSDNGTGISKENLASLFNLDSNISSTGTANEKGSGLGLLLCKEFVEKHGGKIEVESDVGKGSSFKFIMPAAKIPN